MSRSLGVLLACVLTWCGLACLVGCSSPPPKEPWTPDPEAGDVDPAALSRGFEEVMGYRLGSEQSVDWHSSGKFSLNRYTGERIASLLGTSVKGVLTPNTSLRFRVGGAATDLVVGRREGRVQVLAAVLPGPDWTASEIRSRFGLEVGPVVWARGRSVAFATDETRSFLFHHDGVGKDDPRWAVVRISEGVSFQDMFGGRGRALDASGLSKALGGLDGGEGWLAQHIVALGPAVVGAEIGKPIPYAMKGERDSFRGPIETLTGGRRKNYEHLDFFVGAYGAAGVKLVSLHVELREGLPVAVRVFASGEALSAACERGGLVRPKDGAIIGALSLMAALNRPQTWWLARLGKPTLVFVTKEEDEGLARERPFSAAKLLKHGKGDTLAKAHATLKSVPGEVPEGLSAAVGEGVAARVDRLEAIAKASIGGRLSVALRLARGKLAGTKRSDLGLEAGEAALVEGRLTEAGLEALLIGAGEAVEKGYWGTALGYLALIRWPRVEGVAAPPKASFGRLQREAARQAMRTLGRGFFWTKPKDPAWQACVAAAAEQINLAWRGVLCEADLLASLHEEGALPLCFTSAPGDWQGTVSLERRPGVRRRTTYRNYRDREAKRQVDRYLAMLERWKGIQPKMVKGAPFRENEPEGWSSRVWMAVRGDVQVTLGPKRIERGRWVQSTTTSFDNPMGSPKFSSASACSKWMQDRMDKECPRPSEEVMKAGSVGLNRWYPEDAKGALFRWKSTLERSVRVRWLGESSASDQLALTITTPGGAEAWVFFDEDVPEHFQSEAKLRAWLTQSPKQDAGTHALAALKRAHPGGLRLGPPPGVKGDTPADTEERAWRALIGRDPLSDAERDVVWILDDSLRQKELATAE